MSIIKSLMAAHFAAFQTRFVGTAGIYEKRNAPDLAATIDKIAEGFETHKATVEDLQRRLDRAETRAARPGAQVITSADVTGPDEQRVQPPTREERAAFGHWAKSGDSKKLLEARAALNATTGPGADAVVPWFDDIVRSRFITTARLLELVGRRRVQNFPCKHVVSNGAAFEWVTETATRNETDAPQPLVVTVPAGEWSAMPSISTWALQDLGFDAEQWLAAELRLAYVQGLLSAIVAGNGTGKPTGFLHGAPTTEIDGVRAFGTLRYFPTGQSTTLPATTSLLIDLLLDIVASLGWMYRTNAKWVMNAMTAAAMRKFKDADGRPVLIDSLVTPGPATMLGYEVVEVEIMPSIGAGAIPIAFGDFQQGYVLDEDFSGVRMTRDEITTKGYVKFYTRTRIGGAVLDSNAIRLVKVAAS
jgi:HK97 family phage major capsid protein